jgi:hypothetical protein
LTKLVLTSTFADLTSPITRSRKSRSSESQTSYHVSAGSVTRNCAWSAVTGRLAADDYCSCRTGRDLRRIEL